MYYELVLLWITRSFFSFKDETPPPPINNFPLIRAKDKKLMFNIGIVVTKYVLSECVCVHLCLGYIFVYGLVDSLFNDNMLIQCIDSVIFWLLCDVTMWLPKLCILLIIHYFLLKPFLFLLAVRSKQVSQNIWEYFQSTYGGGPAITISQQSFN